MFLVSLLFIFYANTQICAKTTADTYKYLWLHHILERVFISTKKLWRSLEFGVVYVIFMFMLWCITSPVALIQIAVC